MSSRVVLETLPEASFPHPWRSTINLPSLWQCHYELFCRHYWRQTAPILGVQPPVFSPIVTISSWVVLQTLLETSCPHPRRSTTSLLPHCDNIIMSCSADITGDELSPSSTFNHQSPPSLWQCHHELFCRHYWRQAVPVLDVQPSVFSLIVTMSSWVVLQTLLEASCPRPPPEHQSHKSCRPDPHLSPVVWSCLTTPASLPCSETCHWFLGCGELHVGGGIHAGSAGKKMWKIYLMRRMKS